MRALKGIGHGPHQKTERATKGAGALASMIPGGLRAATVTSAGDRTRGWTLETE